MSRLHDDEVYKIGHELLCGVDDNMIDSLYQGKYDNEDDFAISLLEDVYNIPSNLITYFNVDDFSTDLFAYDYVISDDGHVFHK